MRISNCWYESVCTNECSNNCIRYIEMQYLMDSSNIPPARQQPVVLHPPACDYDAFCRLADIKDCIGDFVKAGSNVYITSSVTGNGKTSWAIKLMLKYFDTVWAGNGCKPRGVFVHVPTFLLKCKEFGKNDTKFEDLKSNINNVDLVIWDDIASNELSTYDCGQLLMYLDTRISNMKSNIYTGNLNTQELIQRALGSKLASRIWSTNTEIVKFEGADRR